MLHSVGARLESLFFTDRACHIARTVDLHMHFKIVMAVEGPGTLRTRVQLLLLLLMGVDAADASRSSCTLGPLVVAKVVRIVPLGALTTLTIHVIDACCL
jgi:hypothetical protein